MTAVALADDDRILPPHCGFNLRDFGGYATRDGGHVRTGLLYRGGVMAAVTPDGRARLAELGIAAICDLRSSGERAHRPTRWHEGLDVEFWARDYGRTAADIVRAVRDVEHPEQTRAMMIALYRDIAYDHLSSYRAMFAMLVRGRVPLLVNCSAGKDRTGVAVALVLTALGVPRATIFADYLLTGRADFSNFLVETLDEGRPASASAAMAPLFAADPAYLTTMFEAVEERDGTVEAYLERHLDVGTDARAGLRALLVDG